MVSSLRFAFQLKTNPMGPIRFMPRWMLRLFICASLAATSQAAVQFQLLSAFGVATNDGRLPQAALIEGSDGVLYGTTSAGGSNDSGTVFKLNKDGTGYAILHHFNGTDGANLLAGVIEGSDGALYGTANAGGSNNIGTIFKVSKDGTGFVDIHSFAGNDGANPQAALIKGSDGLLYGTTSTGGPGGAGTVFKLNNDGSDYTLLHSFGSTDGDAGTPLASVIEASDGFLYGTTSNGGTNSVGSVFKFSRDGTVYSVIFSFERLPFGGCCANPKARLLEGPDGALYGILFAFGSSNVVFKIKKDGTGYTVVAIPVGCQGRTPDAGLILGPDGAIYGTSSGGCSDHNRGFDATAFRIPSTGIVCLPYQGLCNISTLIDFSATWAGLMSGSDGIVYGVTRDGGSGAGTIFKFLPPDKHPEMLGINPNGGPWLVIFTGVAGENYELLRSTDFRNWTALTNVVMPFWEQFQFLDTSPPVPQAFYRAAWVP
jgi:uncharacterized repeat protein (TIGR03803 family)